MAYSKLIAALLGNVVALVLAWAATKGIGACTPDGVCTVLGLSQLEITAALVLLVNAVFVHQAPANKA